MIRTFAITAVALVSAGLMLAAPAAAGDTKEDKKETCNPFDLEGQAQKDCIDSWVKDICEKGGGGKGCGDAKAQGLQIKLTRLANGTVQAAFFDPAQDPRPTPAQTDSDRDDAPRHTAPAADPTGAPAPAQPDPTGRP